MVGIPGLVSVGFVAAEVGRVFGVVPRDAL